MDWVHNYFTVEHISKYMGEFVYCKNFSRKSLGFLCLKHVCKLRLWKFYFLKLWDIIKKNFLPSKGSPKKISSFNNSSRTSNSNLYKDLF